MEERKAGDVQIVCSVGSKKKEKKKKANTQPKGGAGYTRGVCH